MKNIEKIFLIIADILIFSLLIYPMLKGGIVGGYDPGFHMARIHTLATNITSGHFPNPIGFEYLDKFGYGVGFFYGNFFIYPFAILNALGLGLFKSYAVYLITFSILNIVSINFVIHKLFHNTWATILSAPIYLSSYYLYGVIYMRAAAGELIAFALIPWVLLSTFKLIKGQTKYWPMLSVSLGLLLVSHILSFLITVGAVLIIFILNLIPIFKDKKLFFSFVKSGLLFLGLTSVFLFSFVQQYTSQKFVDTSADTNGNYGIITNSMLMKNHIFDTQQFVAINGIFLVILLLLSFIYYLYIGHGFHFTDKVIPQAFIVILLYSSLLLSTDLLKIVVKVFKPIVMLQVISRVNVVILPLLTMVVANAIGLFIQHWGRYKIPFTVAFLTIISVITIMFPIKSNLDFVATRKGPITGLSVSMGEYEPKAFMNYNLENMMQVNTSFLERTGNYQVTTNNHHKLTVKVADGNQSKIVMLPRIYYKGYRITANYQGKTIPLPTLITNGLVATKLPSDFKNGQLTVTYRTTTVAKTGWAITIFTLLLVGLLLLRKYLPKRHSTGELKSVA